MLAQVTDLDEKVESTARKFASDVVRIRYKVSEDWAGDPAICFKVVLSLLADKKRE